MNEVVIVAASRTPVGKFGGTLAKIAASELGAHVFLAARNDDIGITTTNCLRC